MEDVIWELYPLPSYPNKKIHFHLLPPTLSLASFTLELSLLSDLSLHPFCPGLGPYQFSPGLLKQPPNWSPHL